MFDLYMYEDDIFGNSCMLIVTKSRYLWGVSMVELVTQCGITPTPSWHHGKIYLHFCWYELLKHLLSQCTHPS